MLKKSQIYWYCQVAGWTFYIAINYIFFGLNAASGWREYLVYFFMLLSGIAISHAYRNLLVRFGVLEFKIPSQLLYIVVFSFLKAIVFFVINLIVLRVLGLSTGAPSFVTVTESVLNFAVIFCFWNVIYFGFQYFQNYKRTEINSLRYLAASRESELNNLKAQLNPHFIFNCMNSIRALIDEDPAKAKTAVSQLSNILRNTLLIDKSREIALKDELSLVSDFLNLEKIRYEERLSYRFEVAEAAMACLIPPFIIQSQVENAIKHGISKIAGGGEVVIKAARDADKLNIVVTNTGKIETAEPLTGVGFKNSLQRLELLYGNKASIGIDEVNGMVQVTVVIPFS